MIIGISGKKQSGKDTVGTIIQYLMSGEKAHYIAWCNALEAYDNSAEKESGWEVKKFADKLKDIVCLLIGCTREQLEDETFKNSELGEEWWNYVNIMDKTDILPYLGTRLTEPKQYNLHKPTPRYFLQYIGSELFRFQIHENTWVNATMADYKPLDGRTMQDPDDSNIGFPNWIITDTRFPNEAKAIKNKNGVVIRVNRNTGNNDQHISEIALDDYKDWDYVIDNNGTLDELIEKVLEILKKEKIL